MDGSKMISWHISRIHNFHGIFDSASVSAAVILFSIYLYQQCSRVARIARFARRLSGIVCLHFSTLVNVQQFEDLRHWVQLVPRDSAKQLFTHLL